MTFKDWLRPLGPGLITAALVFGPSKITITSKLGADYGFDLLWVVVVAVFFMAIFTAMAGRIGMATGESFLSIVRKKWGRGVAVATGLGVFMVTSSFQAGNAVGVGIALGELFATPAIPWIITLNIAGASLLFFRTFYRYLERIMILLIVIMLAAFLTTLIVSKPPALDLATGLRPTVPHGSVHLVIAFVASCFSIVGACYQCYLVQERKKNHPAWKGRRTDSLPGILILGTMSAMVLICAGAVLNPRHIHLNTASDMARALAPVFGSYASVIFLVGLFGASFSSLIGNASLGGTLLSDALGFGSSLRGGRTRALIALIMAIGAAVAITFGALPLQLIIFAQAITILIVPFIGIALYLVGNDKEIMGDLVNSVGAKISGSAGLLLLLALAVQAMITIFFS